MQTEQEAARLARRVYQSFEVNCAQTVLLSLSELFPIALEPQVLDAAIAMNGAARRGGQCGVLEGALMFMGLYFAANGFEREKSIDLCGRFVDLFKDNFGSVSCTDLRPAGFCQPAPRHVCAELIEKGVGLSWSFITRESSAIESA